jgi:hypothetical protein
VKPQQCVEFDSRIDPNMDLKVIQNDNRHHTLLHGKAQYMLHPLSTSMDCVLIDMQMEVSYCSFHLPTNRSFSLLHRIVDRHDDEALQHPMSKLHFQGVSGSLDPI